MSTTARIAVVAAVALVAGGLLGATLTHGPSNTAAPSAPGDSATDRVSTDAASEVEAQLSPRQEVREAAITYASASQDWLYLTDDEIEEAIRAVTVPERADQLVRETVSELGMARDGLRYSAGRIWWFVRPLATKVESLTSDRALVSVWVVTVLSAADVAVPQSDWMTLDVALRRVGDRWLLESIDDTVGPTPLSGVGDEPWQPEPFDDALAGFERIGSEMS